MVVFPSLLSSWNKRDLISHSHFQLARELTKLLRVVLPRLKLLTSQWKVMSNQVLQHSLAGGSLEESKFGLVSLHDSWRWYGCTMAKGVVDVSEGVVMIRRRW